MLTLVVAIVLVSAGLAGSAALALAPKPAPTGVARSLQLARTRVHVPDAVPLTERPAAERIWGPLLGTLGRFGARITPVGTPQRLRRRLDLAGNQPPWDMEGVLAIKAAGLICLGGMGLFGWLLFRTSRSLAVFVGLALIGYWLADILLYNAGQKRQETMRQALPDALDMLTVCVEAGLGFDAGLAHVAEKTSGPLAADFARLLREVQLGRSRAEAFAELAARTDVIELKTFVASLVQADALGVPIAGVLREQAHESRLRRRQRAEEKAQKVPVKIIFPVLFCIFPTFFIVVMGPGAIRIYQTLIHG